MTTTTARKVFKVLGTTDEVTECEHCGRVDLKGTIRLGELDEDGSVGGVTYFGAVCGARAAGWTTKDIRKMASKADREAAEAEREARRAAMEADYRASVLLRYTDQCPLAPQACRYDRRGCPVHGDAPRKVYAD